MENGISDVLYSPIEGLRTAPPVAACLPPFRQCRLHTSGQQHDLVQRVQQLRGDAAIRASAADSVDIPAFGRCVGDPHIKNLRLNLSFHFHTLSDTLLAYEL